MNARVLPSLLCRAALPVLVAAALHPAQAQNATTIPVGYIKSVSLGSNATSNISTNTDVSISLPLKRPVVFASAVASVSGSDVTIQNATFGAGNLTTEPHLLEIASGNQTGVTALITSHNATTCTVDVPTGLSLNGVVSGDAVRIRKAWTLKSLFTNATVPDGSQALLNSGSTPGTNLPPDGLYECFSGDWYDVNNEFALANDTVLFHGENIIVRNNSGVSQIANLTLVGEVPAHKFQTAFVNANGSQTQDISTSYNSPVPEILGNSTLGSVAQNGDQLLVLNNSASGLNKPPGDLLEAFDGRWYDVNNEFNDVTDSYELQPGIGLTYRRGANATATVWNQTPTYLPLD